jgi:ABC-type multidrug transport system fused ATPase/permease subunit
MDITLKNTINLYYSNYIKNNKNKLIYYFITAIIFSIIQTLGITFLLNKITPNKKDRIYIYLLILYFLFIIYANHLINKYTSIIASEATKDSRSIFLKEIINKYSNSYKDIKIGDYVNRIMISTTEIKFVVLDVLTLVIPELTILCVIVILFLFIDYKISILLALCLFISVFLLIYFGKVILKLKAEQEDIFYKIMDNLSNKYNNLLNTFINNQNEQEKKNIVDEQELYKNIAINAQDKNIFLTTYFYITLAITSIICMYIYIKYPIKNEHKKYFIILIIYFIIYFVNISKIMRQVLSCLGISMGSYHFLKDILNTKNNNKKYNIKNGNIKISNLYFGYNNKYILKNVNLDIKDKDKIALTGRSGSGKTTLAKLLLNLHEYKGTILIDNKNIKDISNEELRKNIVYINQRTVLFEKSVIDNMNYGNNIDKIKIIHLLNKYDLMPIFNNLPNDINEIVKVNGGNLSLGMQKIIILVRGILKSRHCNVMIIDEPLASLDKNSVKKVLKMINEECADKTLLIITHDKAIYPIVDKIIDINNMNNK